VTAQFAFSIVLIVGTIVIYRQIQFVRDRDLDYDPKNLITIGHNEEIRKHYRANQK